MNYKRLTKEDLIKEGISIEIDEAANEINVCRNGKPLKLSKKNNGYLFFRVYARDVKGNIIKKPAKRKYKDKTYDYYTYKMRAILLHRAIYAWVNGEVPEGLVVDHISNKHYSIQDYFPENLQAITQEANSNKDKPRSVRELKCSMHKPRCFFEEKLKKYEALHEQAKKEGQAKEAYKRMSNIDNTKAMLRYWDAHADEYGSHHWREEQKKELKSQIADLFKEIEEQKENNIVCKENGWNYFWHLGVWIIKMKRDKIRELRKELRNLK